MKKDRNPPLFTGKVNLNDIFKVICTRSVAKSGPEAKILILDECIFHTSVLLFFFFLTLVVDGEKNTTF